MCPDGGCDLLLFLLKNCGKPKGEVDRFFISFNRETASIFKGFLDTTKAVELLTLKKELREEMLRIRKRLSAIEAFLEKE